MDTFLYFYSLSNVSLIIPFCTSVRQLTSLWAVLNSAFNHLLHSLHVSLLYPSVSRITGMVSVMVAVGIVSGAVLKTV